MRNHPAPPSVPQVKNHPTLPSVPTGLFLSLLTEMLERDPAKRITAAWAMNHPWLREQVRAYQQAGRPNRASSVDMS